MRQLASYLLAFGLQWEAGGGDWRIFLFRQTRYHERRFQDTPVEVQKWDRVEFWGDHARAWPGPATVCLSFVLYGVAVCACMARYLYVKRLLFYNLPPTHSSSR